MADAVNIDLRDVRSLCGEARRLVREGVSPAALVYAWRGETLCFTPKPLGWWAAHTVQETDTRSARLVRYRPPVGQRVDGLTPQTGEVSPQAPAPTPETTAALRGCMQGGQP